MTLIELRERLAAVSDAFDNVPVVFALDIDAEWEFSVDHVAVSPHASRIELCTHNAPRVGPATEARAAPRPAEQGDGDAPTPRPSPDTEGGT